MLAQRIADRSDVHPSRRYQSASDGSSILVGLAAPVALYISARIFAYLSLLRIVYIAFLWITLRPLARKYFSSQIDQVHAVVSRFINTIMSSPAPQPPAQASESKKEM